MMRFIICFLLINFSLHASWQGKIRATALKKADVAFGTLYPYAALTYPLATPLETVAFTNSAPEFQVFAQKYGYFSSARPLVGKVTLNRGDVLIAIEALKLIHEKISDPFLRSFATDEILVKILAYRTLSEKEQIPIGPVIYEVDTVFDLWHGMPAFGLVPKENSAAPPLLIFRGTDFSFMHGAASIYSDLDPKGPGFTVFLSAQPKIHAWLEKVGKARVLGFSLGGTLAAYTALLEKEHILEAVAFNMAGVSWEIQEQWKKENPSLKSYVMQGDFVAKLGNLIGTIKVASADQTLYPIATHTTLISFLPRFYLSKGQD